MVLLDSRCSKDSKGMDFTRLDLNLISNFYLNRVYIVSRHMAASDWRIPVRSDRGRGLLDLK
jgi:hypothetical protein